MSKKILILLGLQLCIHTLLGQNITGTWYKVSKPNSTSSFEIIINESNGTYSGVSNLKRRKWPNHMNVPLKNVQIKDDSLFIERKYRYWLLHYKLKWDAKTKTYKGLVYYNTTSEANTFSEVYPTAFSRTPTKRNTTVKKAPKKRYTRQDTLRGAITPQRAWWNLTHYTLDFELDIENKYIKGSNTITYTVLDSKNVMQIDLQPPMKITKVNQDGASLTFTQEGNTYFIQLDKHQAKGASKKIEMFYEGSPRAYPNSEWWGKGFTYEQDTNGNPFIYTAVQGNGASMWWPNKDHMYDEPDNGMTIRVNVPEDLVAVSNGKLTATEKKDNGTTTYQWTVVNPISNYSVSLNIANYVHFSDIYNGKKGALTCNYYVLPENLEKAKIQFKQVPLMLEAFEHWFGPYPFYEDSYKLVDGIDMGHQSAVGYSGGYVNGYLGDDYSSSGWGLKFDYLIVHESGHEWFGNSITYKDMADMWIHEGFATYAQALYVEYYFGKKAGNNYIKGVSKERNYNDTPIIGDYGINDTDYTRDVYYKGAILLHTLRQVINDDEKWRAILTGLNTEFYHKTVTSTEVESYIATQAGLDLNKFFEQYLRTTKTPTLEYYFEDNKFAYRWTNAVPEFDMPLKVTLNNQEQWIQPKSNWTFEYRKDTVNELTIDPNFYVASFKHIKDK